MKALTAALALTTALSSPALAFDPAAMSQTEKDAFGAAVKDYLMENPEVLVEAINALEERRVANEAQNDSAMVKANAEDIFNDGHSWVGGNPDGDLTMVEFIDYKCSVCRRFTPDVEKAVANDGNVRFILKELPILGQESDLAARFAIAVQQIAGDGAYKKVHDALMTQRAPVTVESLTQLAKQTGVDADAAIKRMHTEPVSDVLRANAQLAERMRIMGTPTFIIGDQMLRGVPRAGMTATLAEIRKTGTAQDG
ncbi:DsbA family protein [Paracoccus jiaweipingae]|uniref:DsbA family protein n=1 Tax=unclassified Paracoccus (in: a-proteobacteria) TaxID=2688777 RepID=UPI0037C61C18